MIVWGPECGVLNLSGIEPSKEILKSSQSCTYQLLMLSIKSSKLRRSFHFYLKKDGTSSFSPGINISEGVARIKIYTKDKQRQLTDVLKAEEWRRFFLCLFFLCLSKSNARGERCKIINNGAILSQKKQIRSETRKKEKREKKGPAKRRNAFLILNLEAQWLSFEFVYK